MSGGKLKETERIQGTGPGPQGAMVAQKAMDFRGSLRRLLGRMRPERTRTLAVLVLTVLSVLGTSIGPRVLGHATDLVFAGLIGGRLPEGVTKAEAVAGLRAEGDGKVADMVSAMDVVPGQGSTSMRSGWCC
ncbi:hypothetical protein [Nocardioides alcanivorans]|uniref:hypothetical protein n=1 Tax=Nocardioides alcanivorans TaxID=2897352 RepID=UPI00289DF235|nr:hypothetical protein [Nocardioides alcanivorans]